MYINFPVQLLKGFLTNPKNQLSDMLDYAVYVHSKKMEYSEGVSAFKASAKYYGVTYPDLTKSHKVGVDLYKKYGASCPMAGMKLTMWWEYYNGQKSEHQLLYLIGFLALRSILGDSTYCKTENSLFFSRMDGQVKKVEIEALSKDIAKYCATKHKANYWAVKIKDEIYGWGLKSYSWKTRGFYITTKLSIDELVFEAEKKRDSVKKAAMQNERKNARAIALERIKKLPP